MKVIGKWKEYYPRTGTGSVYEKLTNTKNKYDSSIISYLEKGIKIMGTKGGIKCVLTGEEWFEMSAFTDGEWSWTSEFIHYVKMQKITIPEEFIIHMQKNKFVVPNVEEIGIKRLGEIGRLFM